MSPVSVATRLTALGVLLAGIGCVPELAGLEGKGCAADGACAPGFACDPVRWVCVSEGAVADAGDGGTDPFDAGPSDAGPVDAGPTDAGPGDAGPVDAGPGDGGPADACVPTDEICNGLDDDCDGTVDFPDGPPYDYVPPSIEILTPAADPVTGYRQLIVAEPVEARLAVDARGAQAGPVRWYLSTRDGPVATGRLFDVGPTGSTAQVKLPVGRHRLLATFTDGCGARAEAFVDLQVGQPLTAGPTESLQAVCLSPAGVVWTAGTDGVATRDPNLAVVSANGMGDGQACAVGDDESGFVGRDGDREKVRKFSDPADLSQRADVEVEGDLKMVMARSLARDPHGRMWMVAGDGLLKVLVPGDDRFRPMDGLAAPPDAGHVSCLASDGLGGLWVCTTLGVNRLDVSDADLALAGWWRDTSVPLFEGAAPGTRATALAANGTVLWALSSAPQVGQQLARLDLAALVCTGSCDPSPYVEPVPLWEQIAISNARWTDLALWRDGDVFLGTADGFLRVQWPPPDAAGPVPVMAQLFESGAVRDLAVAPGDPWTLYLATQEGLVRYRGE